LLKSLRTSPCFTPEQDRQGRQYFAELCDLIIMISIYPNPRWDFMDMLNTQKINIPVKVFFDVSSNKPLIKVILNIIFLVLIRLLLTKQINAEAGLIDGE